MRTTISSQGKIVLPAELRQQDHIQPGQEFDVERPAREITASPAAHHPPMKA